MNEILQVPGFLNKNNQVSIIQNQEVINIQSERIIFFKSDGLTLGPP